MSSHVVPLLRSVEQRILPTLGTASAQLQTCLVALLCLLLVAMPSVGFAADLPVTFYEEEEDENVWEVETFANIFFMLNGLSSGAGGSGIIAQDNPTLFGNPAPSTQSISMSDVSSSGGNLIELGANVFRNSFGIGGSVLFGVGGGGGGSSTFGYTPLSHGGTPGNIGSGPDPDFNDPPNLTILFNPPLTTGPVVTLLTQDVHGGVRVSSQGSSFRSYEANLIYRQNPGCDEDDPECACPDKANPLCESRWKVHIGPRYFEFGEVYELEMEGYIRDFFGGGAVANSYSYYNLELAGLNEIYGLQIGGEYKLLKNYWDRVDLSLAGRVGYGINHVTGGVSGLGIQRGSNGSPLVSFGGGSKDKLGTLFGQLDVGLSVDVTKNIELSAGYRGLWIEKTVSAAGQFSSIDVVQDGSVSEGGVAYDDMLLHMGRVGLNISF